MKTFTSAFIILAYTMVTISAASLGLKGEISPTLRFVGAADGKSFFADDTQYFNWTRAGEYCQSMGMTLAEITSQAQVNALTSHSGSDFDGYYWVGGRDAQELRQFSWNSTGEQPTSGLFTFFRGYAVQTCMYIHPAGSILIGSAIKCSENYYSVLCEAKE